MATESLSELQEAFEEWRRNKKNPKERIPSALLVRARRVAAVHGAGRIGYKLGIATARLSEGEGASTDVVADSPPSIPRFTRIEVAPPPRAVSPLAEAETPSGVKLRLFSITTETAALLSSFCRAAGGGA